MKNKIGKSGRFFNISLITRAFFAIGFTSAPPVMAETFSPVIGMVGTPGDDLLNPSTLIEATADETIGGVGLFDVSAIGISSLEGEDEIANQNGGTVSTFAHIDAISAFVALGVHGEASATGIDAGPDNDQVTAGAPVLVLSRAVNNTVTASFFIEQVPAILGFSSTANSTGIAGDTGTDTLVSNEQTSVTAMADANLNQLTLTPLELPADVFGLGLTPNTADALAVGIAADAGASSCVPLLTGCADDPNAGSQTLDNLGPLQVTADGAAWTNEITAELWGRQRGDTSTEATAAALGIRGGSGGDTITNAGGLDIRALAESTSLAVDVKLDYEKNPIPDATPLLLLLEKYRAAITESNTVAEALAIGIDARDGDDSVTNSGTSGQIGEGPEDNLNLPPGLLALLGDFDDLQFIGPLPDYCEEDSTADICAQAIASSTKLRFEIPVPAASAPAVASFAVTASESETAEIATTSGTIPVSEMGTAAQAGAVGIAGGKGMDAITNSSPFAIETYAFASSLSVSASLGVASKNMPLAINVPIADSRTTSSAETLGLSGGEGGDHLINTDELGVLSTAKASSASVSVDLQLGEKGVAAGVGIADASTEGEAIATGVDGMGGADEITHSGATNSEAHAEILTDSIAVSLSGIGTGSAVAGSLTRANGVAKAESVGIYGGIHDPAQGIEGDIIYNENGGVIEAEAESTAISKSVSFTAAFSQTGVAVGASLADANTTSEAHATGIGTDAGDDEVTSEAGEVTASATAKAASNSVGVTLAGAYEGISLAVSAARANTEAKATAAGIDSGSGDDKIESQAALASRAYAESTANSTSVTVQIAPVSVGAAIADADTASDANAVGISSGDGMDEIESHGVIDVDATATTRSKSIAVNASLIGAGSVDLASTATSHATGIDGGLGEDRLTNTNAILVDASSTINALGAAGNLIGHARGDLSLTARASAFGIVGGDAGSGATAGNTIDNREEASINVTANAHSNADNYVVQGGGQASVKGGSATEVVATGLLGGFGVDTVTNGGGLDVEARSVNSVIGFGFTGAGFQTVDADVSAEATATGIDVGEGEENSITNANDGTIAVHAHTENLAGSVGAGILDFSFTSASAGARTAATGILSGEGEDSIENYGDIAVTASVFNDAAAGMIGLFAFSTVDDLSSATLEGINAGGGDDVINNAGRITVGEVVGSSDPNKCLDVSIACARAATVAFDVFSFLKTDLSVTAGLAGISGGSGNDTINNSGSLTVGDADDWMVISETDSITSAIASIFEFGLAVGNAELESIGLTGGDGSDGIANSGELTVHARALNDVYSIVEIETIGLTTSEVVSKADTGASATGIAGDAGDDELDNSGALTVNAHAKTVAEAVMKVGISGANSTIDVDSNEAVAIGMDGGSGSNKVTNLTEGDMVVESLAETAASTRTTTGGLVTAESGESYLSTSSRAWGMRAGTGDDTLENHGDMSVTAQTEKPGVFAMHGFAEDIVSVGPDLGDNASALPEVANPGLRMNAFATGIAGGAGEDKIVNTRSITVSALSYPRGKAETNSSDVTVDDFADISILSNAAAIGLSGEGVSTGFINTEQAVIAVTARANGYAEAVADSATGAYADAWLRTVAEAVGIRTQGFADIDNGGTIAVAARAEPTVVSTVDEGGGYTGNAKASAIGEAVATGFVAGDSGSLINNRGALAVTARAAPLSLFGATSVADNRSQANASSNAFATGIQAGSGYNEIINEGTLTVEAIATNGAFGNDADSGDAEHAVAKASAEAKSRGISAGVTDGNDVGNLVWNAGDISVSASATAYYWLGDYDEADVGAEAGASAIGIETGGGDDIVYNAGSIITRAVTQEQGVVVRQSGTAISSGAGNDEVYLQGDSRLDGLVMLGAGEDLIAFRDTARLLWSEEGVSTPGVVIGGDGIDSLRIQDRNSFTIAPPDSLENLEVDQGRLVITDDYVLPEEGLLKVAVYNPDAGDSGNGQLVVDGNSALGGGLSVAALPRIYHDGQTFDVMTAEWIDPATRFSLVDLPDPTPLLSFGLVEPLPLDQIVRIEVAAAPFDSAARYPLHRIIGDYLDRLAPEATGDLSALLGAFQLTPESEIDGAFSGLSPDSYQALTAIGVMSGLDQLRSLERRLRMLRAPFMNTGLAGLGSGRYLLAYTGDDPRAVGVPDTDEIEARPGEYLAADAFLVSGHRDASQGYAGFDQDAWGFALSPQFVHDNVMGGVSLGYSRSSVEFSGGRGDGDIRAWYAGIFGSLYNDNAYVDAGLLLSDQDYQNRRVVRIDGFRATAESEHDADVVQAFLGSGYRFDTNPWALEPYVSLYYTVIEEEGFTETGADSANLTVEPGSTDSLIGEAGIRVARRFDTTLGDLDIDLGLGINHDFRIDDRKVTAGLVSAPGTSFAIPERDVEDTSGVLGVGLAFKRRDTTASLRYRGEFNGDQNNQAVFATLQIEF